MVRSVVVKEIPRKKMEDYEELGWEIIGPAERGLVRARKKLRKWEKFEVRMRELFVAAGFEDAIDPYEFWYNDLGNQVDVCGGVVGHFIIMDCTSKTEPGFKPLKEKIKDNLFKMKTLEQGAQSVFKGKYKQIHFVICTEDVDQSSTEVEQARDRGIHVIDKSQLEQWDDLIEVLGPGIRYQILETLAEAKIPIETDRGRPLAYEAMRILVRPAVAPDQEPGYVYVFAIDPETLLKLAVVYRLKYMDPRGYQRDLRVTKLRAINEYLSDYVKFFPNSILVAFDEEGTRRIRWKSKGARAGSVVEVGEITIPRFYSIAEIIDGQHRLYGYIDFTKMHQFDRLLSQRRRNDRLVVVAIPDPAASERPGLYLAINSTQTKIPTREIWALMGETRPTTKMGYISNLVRALNERGTLRDLVEIPRVTRGRRNINIANLGKGIADRRLVDRSGEDLYWNLWKGPRIEGPYPEIPDARTVEQLDLFFRCVKIAHSRDWASRKSFLCSNNGLNVMLRVMVEILRYQGGKPLSEGRVNRLLKPDVREYVNEYGAEELLSGTSNEAARERVGREIMQRINKRYQGFAREYLEERKTRRRS